MKKLTGYEEKLFTIDSVNEELKAIFVEGDGEKAAAIRKTAFEKIENTDLYVKVAEMAIERTIEKGKEKNYDFGYECALAYNDLTALKIVNVFDY
jgi:rRNA-processing protein FCF1